MGGTVDTARGNGTAVVCHCDSCTRAQRHFGVDATRKDGVAIYQTTPDRMSIDQGQAHLALARLTPKGCFRWYAACCNTQIGVSSSTPKFPFVGIVQTAFPDASTLPRPRTHAYVQQHGGPDVHRRLAPSVIAVMARSISALSSGRWRATPFFDLETRRPVSEPTILPKDAGRP